MCHRKMKIAHANFLHSVERYVSTNPEVAAYVSDFVARGLDAARKEAMYRAADMETALSVAIAKRYNGREGELTRAALCARSARPPCCAANGNYGDNRLRLNNSQKAGCIRRSPASHCCQVRQVVCTSSAATVCDKPAASLAARTSAGVGLRDGEPPRERFGWLLIDFDFFGLDGDAEQLLGFGVGQGIKFGLNAITVKAVAVAAGNCIDAANDGVGVGGADVGTAQLVSGVVGGGGAHFFLQPLSPEARSWRIHNLNNTRIARNVKRFYE